MSAPLAVRWNELCSRLGVQPKQFGFLLAATALTVAALGAKTVFKPARATAAAAVRVDSSASSAVVPVLAARQRVELVLESRPIRDPFRPFFINPDAVPGAAPSAGVATGAAAPAGLHLRTIIAGEFAVIGEETVAVGDEVSDSEGHRFVVEEIQERRVVLREGGRRAELGYASAGRASDKSTKGTRK